MGAIEFDFCIASQAKSKLEEAANRMKAAIFPEFIEVVQEIGKYWNGEAGARFQMAARREADEMKHTAELIEHTNSLLGNAVLTAKRIEEETKEIAELRAH